MVQKSGGAKSFLTRHGGQAKTDEQGHYTIKGLNALRYPIQCGKYEREGRVFVAEAREVDLRTGEVFENVDFLLDPAPSISGRIYDKMTGEPISTASITCSQTRDLKALTGADGAYRLENAAPKRYFLKVQAKGYVMKHILGLDKEGRCTATGIHKQLDVLAGQDAVDVDFAMEPESVVKGRVVTPDGEPVAGASVDFLLELGVYYNYRWKIRTDADGAYAIPQINPGTYYVKASKENLVTGRTEALEVAAGQTFEAPDVVLHLRGAIIKGTVRTPAGDPVVGASMKIIQVYGPDRKPIDFCNRVGEDKTNDAGEYFIPMIGLGPVEIQAIAQGQEKVARNLDIDNLMRTYEEDFVLGQTLKIAGIVKDVDGEPLRGAAVFAMLSAEADDHTYMRGADGATTEVDGRFELKRVQEGTSYTLRISLVGYQAEAIPSVQTGEEDLAITLRKCGRIAGRVVDAVTEEPIQDFAVFVSKEGKIITSDYMQNLQHSEDGSFLVDDLQSGPHTVVVLAEGYGESERTGVVVSPEQTTDLGDVALSAAPD